MLKTAFGSIAIALLGLVLVLTLVDGELSGTDEGMPKVSSRSQPASGTRTSSPRQRCTPDLSCAQHKSDIAALQ